MCGSGVIMTLLYLRDKLKPTTDAYRCDYIYGRRACDVSAITKYYYLHGQQQEFLKGLIQ